ncbi:MAG: Glucose/mannose transporter GlcP [Anaerolineales bacterium]|nr:Glucose/mannose transporter GlcP [Anaerolineales bacterium]
MSSSTVTAERKAGALLIGVAYVNFVVLGLAGGMLGVAWPSIRESFHLSLDALGILLISSTLGFLLSSFNSGHITSRIGIGSLLLIGGLVRSMGLLGFAVAPSWWTMVLLGLFSGLGGGSIDAGTNAHFATNHSARLMNWLHASFGLGATLGPLLMTTVFNLGQSWRWGYAIAGALQGLLVIVFILTRGAWQSAGTEAAGASPDSLSGPATITATLKAPTVLLGIVLFFVYAGIEAITGQWTFTLLTEARSVAVSTAGFWVSFYWGSFTAGRLLFGVVADRLKLVPALRLCMLGAIIASVLIWLKALNALSLFGLALMGLALAPIFPLLVSATPKRVGAESAANAVGFQVGAAGLGIGALPAFAGVLAERISLEIIGPYLLAASITMFLLHEKIIPPSNRR